MTPFYDKLKDFRKEKRFTIREVANRSGVSPSYISQLENGQRGIPSPDVLLKLSEGLNVSYAQLMKEAGYLEPLPQSAPEPGQIVELRRLLRDYDVSFDGLLLTYEEKAWVERVLEAMLSKPDRNQAPEAGGQYE